MKNIIVWAILWIKRFFRRREPNFEVWDISAISKHLDRLQARLGAESDVVILIPEVVIKQLSDEYYENGIYKEAYMYILKCVNNNKLRFVVTALRYRNMPVAEQVVATVGDYHNKGYNVTLVTCDEKQANIAELMRFNIILF